jgi:hypothetical protein
MAGTEHQVLSVPWALQALPVLLAHRAGMVVQDRWALPDPQARLDPPASTVKMALASTVKTALV